LPAHPQPDWDHLSFAFTQTDSVFLSQGFLDREPVWNTGEFLPFGDLSLSPAAAFLSYGLGIFEGLKARKTPDGSVLLFRPDANARRFAHSAEMLMMAPFPEARFVEAALELVRRNRRFVPPPGKGAFYLRPMEHATEKRLGLAPCRQFTVTMYGSPVGPYFPGARREGLRLKVLDQGRVAPGGTGAAKAMGNYAGAIPIAAKWKNQGFNDVLFLDATGKHHVTETSGSNAFAVLRSGLIVTPPLGDQILPGITRDSTIRIAREILGLTVEERDLPLEEVIQDGEEFFCTGTAWTIQNVREIVANDASHVFPQTRTRDALFEILNGIQTGRREDPFGWVQKVAEN